MKLSRFLLALAMLVLFACSVETAFAQKPLCGNSDCEWLQGTWAMDAEGCFVQADYVYRYCNGKYEFEITKIRKVSICTKEGADLFAAVEKTLLKENPMGWPVPTEGNCLNVYHTSRASCYTIIIGEYVEIIPCNNYECCRFEYKICTVDGEPVITETGHITATNNCRNYAEGCRFSCPEF